jgi:hypothetical protein
MGPNRRAQERERAAARAAQKMVSKLGRAAARRARRRRLIRDAVLAFAIALIVVGAWELLGWFSTMGKVPIFDGR